MFKIKVCPNCATIIRSGEKKCSGCGKTIEEMIAFKSRNNVTAPLGSTKNNNVNNSSSEATDGKNMSSVDASGPEGNEAAIENNGLNKRHKHKKKTQHVAISAKEVIESEKIKANIGADGSVNIDTSDVTFINDNNSKNTTKEDVNYSAKKARGEYELPKIKWWEIYKHADRLLARRKINKEVNKAARRKPNEVSKTKAIILCIFFGYLGVHNFYVKNTRKGFAMLSFFVLSFGLTILISNITALEFYFMSVVGCLGFIVLFMWISDLIALCFNKFKYRTSRMDFIRTLNIETRAKLSKKFIKLENVK